MAKFQKQFPARDRGFSQGRAGRRLATIKRAKAKRKALRAEAIASRQGYTPKPQTEVFEAFKANTYARGAIFDLWGPARG